jgi:hypothetical protein
MAQETGRVNSLLEAYARLLVVGENSIDCLVDTGFTGALVLPSDFVSALETIYVGREVFSTVGGEQLEAEIVLLEVTWLGAKTDVPARARSRWLSASACAKLICHEKKPRHVDSLSVCARRGAPQWRGVTGHP